MVSMITIKLGNHKSPSCLGADVIYGLINVSCYKGKTRGASGRIVKKLNTSWSQVIYTLRQGNKVPHLAMQSRKPQEVHLYYYSTLNRIMQRAVKY